MEPPDLASSRLGRLVEIFDLVVATPGERLPPDSMFSAAPNVISVGRGWVDASFRAAYRDAEGHRCEVAWGMQIPLTRWLDLTVNIMEPNDDRDIVVE